MNPLMLDCWKIISIQALVRSQPEGLQPYPIHDVRLLILKVCDLHDNFNKPLVNHFQTQRRLPCWDARGVNWSFTVQKGLRETLTTLSNLWNLADCKIWQWAWFGIPLAKVPFNETLIRKEEKGNHISHFFSFSFEPKHRFCDHNVWCRLVRQTNAQDTKVECWSDSKIRNAHHRVWIPTWEMLRMRTRKLANTMSLCGQCQPSVYLGNQSARSTFHSEVVHCLINFRNALFSFLTSLKPKTQTLKCLDLVELGQTCY